MTPEAFVYFEKHINEKFSTLEKNQERQDKRLEKLEEEFGNIKQKVMTFSGIVSVIIGLVSFFFPYVFKS
jgi:hypothetical protein